MENVFELVGYQKYDFTDQKTGKQVRGQSVHFITEPTSQQKQNGFYGKVSGKISFPADAKIPSQFKCGEYFEWIFGFTGGQPKVIGFRPVNK